MKKVSTKIALMEFGVALVLGCSILGIGAGLLFGWNLLGGSTSQKRTSQFVTYKLSDSRSGFSLARIYKRDGDVYTQLAEEARNAQSLGQTPFVEFDASW